jgi:hypothetical protein
VLYHFEPRAFGIRESALEVILHRHFAKRVHRGEWFAVLPERALGALNRAVRVLERREREAWRVVEAELDRQREICRKSQRFSVFMEQTPIRSDLEPVLLEEIYHVRGG